MQSKKAYELVTTGKAGVPGIPARDGFNGFLRDLPGDRLCCHRRLARLSAKLDASVEASGPHDFDETAPLGKCFASERKQDIFSDWAGQVICETAWPSSMRARTQLSLRAQRSNPASEPQSGIASALRSSQ